MQNKERQGTTINAFNIHDTQNKRVQAGGVALFVKKEFMHLVSGTGRDPSGLG